MNLTQIALKYKTDKPSNGYTEHYERHFKSLRYEKINILEIGVKRKPANG